MDVHPWMDKVENSCPKNHAINSEGLTGARLRPGKKACTHRIEKKKCTEVY